MSYNKQFEDVKHNLVATSDPGVGDDDADGYGVNSHWLNTTSGELFYCTDASTGAAVWASLTSGGARVLPRGYLDGLVVDRTLVSDPDHDFNLRTGRARSFDDTEDMVLSSDLTDKQSDVAWAVGSSAGALLSGTLDADSWYGFWLIKRTDTGVVDVGIEKNKINPDDTITLPANYDKQRFIFAMITDSSGNWDIGWTIFPDRVVIFDDPQFDVNDATIDNGTPETVTVSVPPNCIGIFTTETQNDSSDDISMSIKVPGIDTDQSPIEASTTLTIIAAADGDIRSASREMYPVDSNQQIQYIARESNSTPELNISTHGFIMTTVKNPYD